MVNMISNMAEPFRVVCLLIIALVNCAKNLRTPVFLGVLKFFGLEADLSDESDSLRRKRTQLLIIKHGQDACDRTDCTDNRVLQTGPVDEKPGRVFR